MRTNFICPEYPEIILFPENIFEGLDSTEELKKLGNSLFEEANQVKDKDNQGYLYYCSAIAFKRAWMCSNDDEDDQFLAQKFLSCLKHSAGLFFWHGMDLLQSVYKDGQSIFCPKPEKYQKHKLVVSKHKREIGRYFKGVTGNELLNQGFLNSGNIWFKKSVGDLELYSLTWREQNFLFI